MIDNDDDADKGTCDDSDGNGSDVMVMMINMMLTLIIGNVGVEAMAMPAILLLLSSQLELRTCMPRWITLFWYNMCCSETGKFWCWIGNLQLPEAGGSVRRH